MSLTEMVLMPVADYKAACDAIREKTETTDLIKSGQMADAIRSIAGGDTSKLYVGQVIGNGTNGISFDVPFAPDYVSVLPTDPVAQTRSGNTSKFIWFYRDFKTFGRVGGLEQHYEAGSDYRFNVFTNNGIASWIKYENATVTFSPPPALSNVVWLEGFTFTVVALKYVPDGATDKDLLEQYVWSLPEEKGGTVTISSRRFAETGMTLEEFDTFTQVNRPNWTFVME